jgi:hypothetical protein
VVVVTPGRLNPFGVSKFRELSLSALGARALSPPVQALVLDLETATPDPSGKLHSPQSTRFRSGRLHRTSLTDWWISTWHSSRSGRPGIVSIAEVSLPVTAPGHLDAVVFWFRLRMDEDSWLSTGTAFHQSQYGSSPWSEFCECFPPSPSGPDAHLPQGSHYRQGAVLVAREGQARGPLVGPGTTTGAVRVTVLVSMTRGVDLIVT